MRELLKLKTTLNSNYKPEVKLSEEELKLVEENFGAYFH